MRPSIELPDPTPLRAAMEKVELWPSTESRQRVEKRLRLARSIVESLEIIASMEFVVTHITVSAKEVGGQEPGPRESKGLAWLDMVRRWVRFIEARPPSVERLEAEMPRLDPKLATYYFDVMGRALQRAIDHLALLALLMEEDDGLSDFNLIPPMIDDPSFEEVQGFAPRKPVFKAVHADFNGRELSNGGGRFDVLFTGTALRQIAEIQAAAPASAASALILEATRMMVEGIALDPSASGGSPLGIESVRRTGRSSVFTATLGALKILYAFNQDSRKVLVLALIDHRPRWSLPAFASLPGRVTGSWAAALRHIGLEPLTEEQRARMLLACEVGQAKCPTDLRERLEAGWIALIDGNETALATLRDAGDVMDAEAVRRRVAERTLRWFRALRASWLEENRVESSVPAMLTHWAYLSVVCLGRDVVPLLVEDMQGSDPMPWGSALQAILGEGPTIPLEDQGRLRRIASHWAAWWAAKSAA